jgi:ribonuclease HI
MVFFLFQWNAHGLHSHGDNLRQWLKVSHETPHAICIQETWLPTNEYFNIDGYRKAEQINTTDLSTTHSQGVAIYIREDCSYIPNKVPENIDCISLKVHYKASFINISTFYQSGEDIDAIRKLEDILTLPNHIVCGDFNAHSPLWYHMGDSRRQQGIVLEDLIDEYNYVCLNDGTPTYIGKFGEETSLDLTFVTPNLANEIHWSVLNDPLASDHKPVLTKYQFKDTSSSTIPQSHPSDVNRYNIKEKDWTGFQTTLNSKIHDLELSDNNFQENYQEFVEAVQQAAFVYAYKPSDAVELGLKKSKPKKLPWWTTECSEAVNAKRKAFHKYHRTKVQSHYLHYKQLRGQAQGILKRTKKQSWRDLCKSFNEKTKLSVAWKIIKSMDGRLKKRKPIPNFVKEDVIYTTNKEKADLLAQTFAQVSSSANNTPIFSEHRTEFESTPECPTHPQFINPSTSLDINLPFTLTDLKRVISSTGNTSPGQDGVTYKMIRGLDDMSLYKLLDIFNGIWETGLLPPSWKHSIVVPIPKPGKEPTSASSYRPISLTSCFCKLFEKIVTARLAWYMEHNKLFDPNQSGFRGGRSTSDNIARLYNDAIAQLNDQGILKAIFLDITKAFDMVWHNGLLFKLKKLGINGSMFNFIQTFLTNRTFQVMVQESLSNIETLQNGTPQGSVISPVLFTIMVNDLPFDPSIQYSIYADDVAVWAGGSSEGMVNRKIQRNLLLLEEWCNKWGFQISPQKTQALMVTRKRLLLKDELYINNVPINFTKTVKYLGVIFDSTFNFLPHIKYITDKCNKRINILRCLTGTTWGSGKESLLILYRGLIRSVMEYACFIYNNVCPTYYKKLEVLQNKALRVICGVPNSTPGSVLQVELGELPIRLRFKTLSMIYGLRVVCSQNNPTDKVFENNPLKNPDKQHCNLLHDLYLEYQSEVGVPVYGNVTPSKPPWTRPLVHIDTLIHDRISKDDDDSLKRNIAHDVMQLYNSRTHIYTDGSKREEKTGFSIYVPNCDLKTSARLTDNISVYSTELFAIVTALFWVVTNNVKESVIFTDSLSSLQAIQKGQDKTNYIIIDIYVILKKIFDKGLRVSLCWVPSHVGIAGNEMADGLAKEALDKENITQIPYTIAELKNRLKPYFINIWQGLWDITEVGRAYKELVPNVDNIIQFKHTNRHIETVITRLRVRHNHLNYNKYKVNWGDTPLCTTCYEAETEEHFLFECYKYADSRLVMEQEFTAKQVDFTMENCLGGDPQAVEIVYKYICSTGRFFQSNWT